MERSTAIDVRSVDVMNARNIIGKPTRNIVTNVKLKAGRFGGENG
jgi:hypothetical protein